MAMFDGAQAWFQAVDHGLAVLLGPLSRVIAWGVIAGVFAMGLYWLLSPQHRLRELKLASAAERRRLADFDGEFAALAPIVKASLAASLKQVTWTLLPAVLASVPLVLLLFMLHTGYSYRELRPGDQIKVRVIPASASISARPAEALVPAGEGWLLTWPSAPGAVELRDARGIRLTQLSNAPRGSQVALASPIDRLVTNPMGTLASDSRIQKLEFDLPRRELFEAGPPWLRGWKAAFFATLVGVSLLIKTVLRIE